jgi:threonine dehydratase
MVQSGASFIHPYDNPRVIAGQGTAAFELMEQAGHLDMVVAPVGGGGLLSGTAVAVTSLFPKVRVIGAEPAGADDAARSLSLGKIVPSVSPVTIADGLLTSLSELTFSVISAKVERIITARDESIIEAMRLIWERMKIVIEPSSALPIAALTESGLDISGLRVGIILSGGNVDLKALPWVDGLPRRS